MKELNGAVCALVKEAVKASGLEAELVAEDLSAPFRRPCIKVELEESGDAIYAGGEDESPQVAANAHLGSGAKPLKGVMTPKDQKPTGYVHLGTANPAKTSYVRLGGKPGGGGGK